MLAMTKHTRHLYPYLPVTPTLHVRRAVTARTLQTLHRARQRKYADNTLHARTAARASVSYARIIGV